MEFFYRAINAQGERVSGHYSARSHAIARRELAENFPSILECREVDSKTQAARNRPYRVKQEAVAIFFRRMSTMLNSGVSLADALHFMVNSEADPSLSQAVDFLTKSVLGGTTLSHAMKDPKLRKVFDQVSIGMVQVGEQTGQLARIMGKLADLKERQLSLSRSLISALTYPFVLFCVILIVGFLFTLILGPGDGGLFAAFGAEIPWPTKVVQSVSSMARQPWLIAGVIAAVLGLAALFRQSYRGNLEFRLRVDTFLLALPILGPLLRKIECARILYVLSDGLEIGLPAIQVMAMARDVCGNEKIKIELSGVLRMFSDGAELNESLSHYRLFPAMVLSMVEVGMESGQLDKVLGAGLSRLRRRGADGVRQRGASRRTAAALVCRFYGRFSRFGYLAADHQHGGELVEGASARSPTRDFAHVLAKIIYPVPSPRMPQAGSLDELFEMAWPAIIRP